MNLLQLVFAFLLLQPVWADKNTLPVFMIDQDQTMAHITIDPNPFDIMSPYKFAHVIHDSIKRSAGIIIFVEETFCVDDISIKDRMGSPFNHLRRSIQDQKAKYFPAVIEPFKLLTQIFPPHKYNVFYLKSRTKLELMDSFKYIYIFFQDGTNETRSDILKRHDLIIREVCSVVRQLKQAPVIAYYTGKLNPVLVDQLRFIPIKPIPIPKDLGVMIVSSGGLFKFSDVFAVTPSRRSQFNQLPTIAEETWSRRSMSTKMAYTDFELEFNFSFLRDQWTLENVALLEAGEEVGRTNMGVGAPWNMSYVCGEPLVIINSRDGSVVTISQYQIQPRRIYTRDGLDGRREGDTEGGEDTPPGDNPPGDNPPGDKPPGDNPPGEPPSFGPGMNCGPYFSSAILTTLMVSGICLSILAYGIVCLMDINTNSRYEDPQSKPLVHTEM